MVACGTLNYCGQAFFVGAVNPNSALLVLTSDGDVDLLDAHSESTGQAFLASSMDKEIIVSSLTGIRCSVSESHGASLAIEQEDAFWQDVLMVQPEQRREFEPSSKRRKSRIASLRPVTG